MPDSSTDHRNPVSVYTCHNPAELPVIESLLLEGGIEYFIRGEFSQNLYGGGLFGGSNLAAGPLDVWVSAADEAMARGLLSELLSGTVTNADTPGV